LLCAPARPFVAIVGGAKVADKLGLLRSLLRRVDRLVVGGGIAFTFLAARGHQVGASLFDAERVDDCRALLSDAGDRIVLPTDVTVLSPEGRTADDGAVTGEVRVVGVDIPDGWRGLDIGPATADAFAAVVAEAGTVVWNGPMGVAEDERFAAGTEAVARAVVDGRGFSVVGGGDSVAVLDRLGWAEHVGFVSTGGGAALELLEHGDLPGLEALRHAPNAPYPAGGV
jgi:phosphoglycerate kinase